MHSRELIMVCGKSESAKYDFMSEDLPVAVRP
jgi:hypothetical protein